MYTDGEHTCFLMSSESISCKHKYQQEESEHAGAPHCTGYLPTYIPTYLLQSPESRGRRGHGQAAHNNFWIST
jgi:hypothetical protein